MKRKAEELDQFEDEQRPLKRPHSSWQNCNLLKIKVIPVVLKSTVTINVRSQLNPVMELQQLHVRPAKPTVACLLRTKQL